MSAPMRHFLFPGDLARMPHALFKTVQQLEEIPWVPERCLVLPADGATQARVCPREDFDERFRRIRERDSWGVWVAPGTYKFCAEGKLYLISVSEVLRGDALKGNVSRPLVRVPAGSRDKNPVTEDDISGRAARVLRIMRDPEGEGAEFRRDGGWMLICQIPSIGRKTINELHDAGMIEAKGNPRYQHPSYFHMDQFRLREMQH